MGQENFISKDEAKKFRDFVNYSQYPIFTTYIYAKLGKLSHLEQDPGYLASVKIIEQLGLDNI